MSKVNITIARQESDSQNAANGVLSLKLDIDGVEYDLSLTLTTTSGYKKFTRAVWVGALTTFQQHQIYSAAFTRDYKDTGGHNNLTARINGNAVEIEAKVGTLRDGNFLGTGVASVTFAYSNSPQKAPVTFIYGKTGEGSCENENYILRGATGDSAPYRVLLSASGDSFSITDWNGVTDIPFVLKRNLVYSITLLNSDGEVLRATQINPTKKIVSSDFKPRVNPNAGHSDVVVETVVERAGTDPLQYKLVDENNVETEWRDSNVFGGVVQGTYTLKVRDVYLCEVSKIFPVARITTILEQNREPYFKISEYNSLSYFNEVKHSDSIRKTYDNTPSWCENVALPKNGVFRFPATSKIPQQFRSSFSRHRATLFRRNLPALPLQFFEIQTNLGVTEKVDCKLFLVFQEFEVIGGGTSILSSGTGVYFEGGNQYEPFSTTPKTDPDSPYNGGLPSWAQKGNSVTIDGKGTFEIIETDIFDEHREVLYFKIAERFPDQDAIVQSAFDRHPYNVFRFNLDMTNIFDEGAFVRIEPGVMSGSEFLIDSTRIYRSEWIARLYDTSKYLKIKWSAFRNIGEMSFTDGIVCEMWLKGRMRPFSDTDSNTDDADDRTNSVNQEAYLRMQGFLPMISTRQWRKLDLVGSIGNRGTVLVEDMELVRISASEQEEQGSTNLSNVTVAFAFSGENTSVGQEDPIYNVDTGLQVNPGSTGKTGRDDVEGWQVVGDEKRLSTVEGEWVRVLDADGTENFVIIP